MQISVEQLRQEHSKLVKLGIASGLSYEKYAKNPNSSEITNLITINSAEKLNSLKEQYKELVKLGVASGLSYEKYAKNPEIQEIIQERDKASQALNDLSAVYFHSYKTLDEMKNKIGDFAKKRSKNGFYTYFYIEKTEQCFFYSFAHGKTDQKLLNTLKTPNTCFKDIQSGDVLSQQQLENAHNKTGYAPPNTYIDPKASVSKQIEYYGNSIDLISPHVNKIIRCNERLKLKISSLEEEQQEKDNTSSALEQLNALIDSTECAQLLKLEDELAKYNNTKQNNEKLPLDKQVSYVKESGEKQGSVFLNSLKENIEKAMQNVRDAKAKTLNKMRNDMVELKINVISMMQDLERKNVIGKLINAENACAIDYTEHNNFFAKHRQCFEALDTEITFASAMKIVESLRQQKESVKLNCLIQKKQINKALEQRILECYRDISKAQGLLGVASDYAAYLNKTEKKVVEDIKKLYHTAEQTMGVKNKNSFLETTKKFLTGEKAQNVSEDEKINDLIQKNNWKLRQAQKQLREISPLCLKLEEINSYHIKAKKIIMDMKLLNEETPQKVLIAICQQKRYIALDKPFEQKLSAQQIQDLSACLKQLDNNMLPADTKQQQRIQRLLMNPLRIKVINELIKLHADQKQNTSSLDDKAFNQLIMLLLDAEDKTIQAVHEIAPHVKNKTTTYEIRLCLVKLILEAKGVSSPMIVNGKEQDLVQKQAWIVLNEGGGPSQDQGRKTILRDGNVERRVTVTSPVINHVAKKNNNLTIPIQTKPGVRHLENAITHPVYGKDNIEFIKHFLFDIKPMNAITPLFRNHKDEQKGVFQKIVGVFCEKDENDYLKFEDRGIDNIVVRNQHAPAFADVAWQTFNEKQEHFEAFDYTRKYLNNETDSFFILPENYDDIIEAISIANAIENNTNISKMATVFNAVITNIQNYVNQLKADTGKASKSAVEIKRLETALKTFRNELIPVLLQNKDLAQLEKDAKKLARQHFQKNFGGCVLLDILQIITFAWIIVMPIRYYALHKSAFFAGQTDIQKEINLQGNFKEAKV